LGVSFKKGIYRGEKGEVYEGGTKVPALVYQPRYRYIRTCKPLTNTVLYIMNLQLLLWNRIVSEELDNFSRMN
jgi:hypothetical protein